MSRITVISAHAGSERRFLRAETDRDRCDRTQRVITMHHSSLDELIVDDDVIFNNSE